MKLATPLSKVEARLCIFYEKSKARVGRKIPVKLLESMKL
jgi:hypothetical protein